MNVAKTTGSRRGGKVMASAELAPPALDERSAPREIRAAVERWAHGELAAIERRIGELGDEIASAGENDALLDAADGPDGLTTQDRRRFHERWLIAERARQRTVIDAMETPTKHNPWAVWDRLVGERHRDHFPNGWRARIGAIDWTHAGDPFPSDGRGRDSARYAARDAAIVELVEQLRAWAARSRAGGAPRGVLLKPTRYERSGLVGLLVLGFDAGPGPLPEREAKAKLLLDDVCSGPLEGRRDGSRREQAAWRLKTKWGRPAVRAAWLLANLHPDAPGVLQIVKIVRASTKRPPAVRAAWPPDETAE